MTDVRSKNRRSTHRDVLRELAYDNHGFVTASDAVEAGVPHVELAKLAGRGSLVHVAHGLYRIPDIPRTPEDQYAEATLRAGATAFLRGESVLAILGLGDVNPNRVTVGVSKRVRRDVPAWMEITRAPIGTKTTSYDGVRAQRVSEAILECLGRVPVERLRDAAHRARSEGWLTTTEWNRIEETLPA